MPISEIVKKKFCQKNFVDIKMSWAYSRERGLRSADVLRVWPLTRSDRYLTDVVREAENKKFPVFSDPNDR